SAAAPDISHTIVHTTDASTRTVEITPSELKELLQKNGSLTTFAPIIAEVISGRSELVGMPTFATWSIATRPQKPKRGTFGFNVETGKLEIWDGKSCYT